jgi:hypothetical protein
MLYWFVNVIANYSNNSELFDKFKKEFHRNYENKEIEDIRFSFFVKNLDLLKNNSDIVIKRDIIESDIEKHSITQWFDKDLSQHELIYPAINIYKFRKNLRFNNGINGNVSNRKLTICNPSSILQDWSSTNYVSYVENAGFCMGSGWAFAVTSQVQSDAVREHGNNYEYVLSSQQLIHCVTSNNGCYGGTTQHAYQYLQLNGLQLKNNYPYTSFWGITGGPCNYNSNEAVVSVIGYFTQLTGNEDCMAEYVQNTGPISVCIAVSSAWYTYYSGIMTLSSCPVGTINHCLQVVGVKPGIGGYWKLKNNFGWTFGEYGYIRLEYGVNVCGITSNPIYTSTQVDL